MMKAFMWFLGLALILGVQVHGTERVDNEWLTSSYGAAGDSVIVEVKAQIEDYQTAKTVAYAIQRGEKEGNLAAAQEDCIKFALFSYVKAMYAAEIGRVAESNGRIASAISAYKKALTFSEKALTVDHTDSGLGKTSKEIGATFKSKAKAALKRLE